LNSEKVYHQFIANLGSREKVPERRTVEVDFPGEGERALWSKDESYSDED
jgi:hypothetical protein